MIRNIILAATALTGIGCIVGAGSASAASYTVNDLVNISLAPTELNGTPLNFTKFNSSLGTLTGIQITLAEDFNTQITVSNAANAGANAAGSASTEMVLGFQDLMGYTPVSAKLTVTNNIGAGAIDTTSNKQSYSNLAPGASTTLTGFNQTNGSYNTGLLTTGGLLTEFSTGTGTAQLNLSTFTTTNLTNTGGNAGASQNTLVDATGTVTYYYAPLVIPEPMSIVLLGSSLLGFGLLRRRSL